MIRIPTPGPVNADFTSRRISPAGGTLNFSGLSQAYDELGRVIGNGPRHKEVDFSPLRDLAKGIQSVGDNFKAVAVANQEVEDTKKLIRGEHQIRLGEETSRQLMAEEPDVNKWPEIVRTHMQGVVESLDMEGITPAAQEHLTNFASRQAEMAVAKARTTATVENQRIVVSEGKALHKYYVDNNMPAEAAATVKALVDSGHVLPKEGALMTWEGAKQIEANRIGEFDGQFKAALKNGRFEDAASMLYTHPDLQEGKRNDAQRRMYAEELYKAQQDKEIKDRIARNPLGAIQDFTKEGVAKDVGPFETEQYINMAQAMARDQSFGVLEQAQRAMLEDKTLTRPEQLEDPRWNKLLPSHRNAIAKTLREGVPNDDMEWMAMASQIQSVQTAGMDEKQKAWELANFESLINIRFSGPFRDGLMDLVNRKRTGTPTDAANEALDMISEAFKVGELGNYRVPYTAPQEEKYNLFGYGPKVVSPAKPGTPLSPEDLARLDDKVPKEQRVEPGEIVTDINAKKAARTRYEQLNYLAKKMEAAGWPAEKIKQNIELQIRGVKMSMIPETGIEVGDSPVNTSGSLMPDGLRQDAERGGRVADPMAEVNRILESNPR